MKPNNIQLIFELHYQNYYSSSIDGPLFLFFNSYRTAMLFNQSVHHFDCFTFAFTLIGISFTDINDVIIQITISGCNDILNANAHFIKFYNGS